MNVDVTPCGECKWWGENPHAGDQGKSWSRCAMTGCLTDSEFYCKYGKRQTNAENA